MTSERGGTQTTDDRLTVPEAVRVTGAERLGPWATSEPIRAVEPDLSRLRPGDMFVALPGSSLDGHELVPIAAIRGAAGAIVSKEWLRRVSQIPLPLLAVDDPSSALVAMARARRGRLNARVIGVTGSVGKTSTKEVIASICATLHRTDRSRGNRNDQVGLPLSLIGLKPNCDVVVLEMAGGHAPDEIRALARIGRPHVGLVTNIHPVHLETMGTIEAIAKSKSALVESLDDDGTAVLNREDPLVADMGRGVGCRVITYGRSSDADVWLENFETAGIDGCRGVLRTSDQRQAFRLPFVGRHAADITLAAAATCVAIGIPLEAVERGAGAAMPYVRPQVRRRPNGVIVIDDSYSSSPAAVASALGLLSNVDGRRVAVLGDMLELGSLTPEAHRELGALAARCADVVVALGNHAATLASAARFHGAASVHSLTADDLDGALAIVERLNLRSGDAVLVKASRALQLDRLVGQLL